MRRCTLAGFVVALAVACAACHGDSSRYDLARVRADWCPSDTRVLDRRGEPLHVTRTDDSGRRLAWTPLSEVSPALADAVIRSEDRRFRSHAGIDWRAVAASAWQYVSGGPPRGASTITMQLAALLDPMLRRGASGRGLRQKLAQMRAARALEVRWTKDEILEAYLNVVTFRGEVTGVRAAADAIYGKDPHGLSPAESAALAASIRAPNAAPGEVLARARRVALMSFRDIEDAVVSSSEVEGAVVSSREIEDAVARLVATPDRHGPANKLIPHAARVLTSGAAPCRDVESSIDGRVQRIAVASMRRHLVALGDRSASDGSVLVVDNATGDVLAYVGSSGDLSLSPETDGVRAGRQAGSTLKPFLYAAAIERGLLTSATLVADEPLDVVVGDTIYRPRNYDHRFRGLVSVRVALAASLNVPAVRTLGLVGADAFAETLRDLGIASIVESGGWYGPSLALGSADVSLWELVGAYRVLARAGVRGPITISRGAGARPFPRDPRVFDDSTAWIVADILSDRASRSPTFELQNALATRYWSAVKTGTSKDMRDNWCIGFTRRFTVGVWIGNFGGEPMRDVSGVTGAAPVWREVMDALHVESAWEDEGGLLPPPGVVAAQTTFANDVEPARLELYRRGTEPAGSAAALLETAEIVTPADGAVIALDPDLPPARQRVRLAARGALVPMRWQLDGFDLGDATTPVLWQPTPSQHELVLVDADGRRVDAVRFEVRGGR